MSAETTYAKSRAFLGEYDSSVSRETLLAWGGWSPAERKRIQNAQETTLAALGAPVCVITANDVPELGLAEEVAAFYQGDLRALDAPRVGIVGTRNSTPVGEAIARRLAGFFATHGVTVVSGGAYGIDSISHSACLSAGGRTISVLANGLDKLYPSAHRKLFGEIVVNGGLMTTHGFGSKLMKHHFLARNKLIAALSQVLIVVQAPESSGALNTLAVASKLNRPCFVPYQGLDAEAFEGSKAAVESGVATQLGEPGEALKALGLDTNPSGRLEVTEAGQSVFDVLSDQPIRLEHLAERTGLAVSELLSELAVLELEGLVVRGPQGFSRLA